MKLSDPRITFLADVEVECVGFSKELLDYLRPAIVNGRMDLVGEPPGLQRHFFVADFLGFRYEVHCREDNHSPRLIVRSIEKIAKVESFDDMEGAQYMRDLNGIERFTEGNVVVEDYRPARQPASYGSW